MPVAGYFVWVSYIINIMELNKVLFRCNRKHYKLFMLNTHKRIITIPSVGDILKFDNSDFHKATYRTKGYRSQRYKEIRHLITLVFVVKSRVYDVKNNDWELICEPTAESLEYCLINLKK